MRRCTAPVAAQRSRWQAMPGRGSHTPPLPPTHQGTAISLTHGAALVHGLANHVKDAAQGTTAHGHLR